MPTTQTSKVWRYFDQKKAEHILKTNKLYLRRLDLLTDYFEGDPYEGNPTFALFERLKQAHMRVFGKVDEAALKKQFECERRATYVSCWQKSDHESWLMWKQYCQEGGGFALQTTLKQMCQLHAMLREQNDQFFFKPVQYLDHWTDDSLVHTVPIQVFVKPVWFTDEKEVRFVSFRSECAWGGTDRQTELALAKLDDHELVQINLNELVESIVLNPFSCECQKKELVGLINSLQPGLKMKLHESAIAKKTILN